MATDAAERLGMRTWALTGPPGNPLAERAEESLTVDAGTATVQEIHLIAVHLLCDAVDAALANSSRFRRQVFA